MYALTEEGRLYLKHGMPEQKLVELLKQPLELSEAKAKVENFAIALQWAKKKGLIEIRNSKICLIKKPQAWPEHEGLKKISEGEQIDDELLKLLLRRRLVEVSRKGIVKRAEALVGKKITWLTEELIKTGKWQEVKLKPYNVEAPGKKIFIGKKQPYLAFLDWVKQRLIGLGFEEMTGPLIETEFWNMDALYMPQHHAARDIHDVYFIKAPRYAKTLDKKLLRAVKAAHERGVETSKGWEYRYDIKRAHRLILRSHCTVLSAKTLASRPRIPGRYFSIARCFRYEKPDARHLPDFFQVEGIVLDHGLNFRHLVGILKLFAREFAGTSKIELRPGYFPFTEPSIELHVKHPKIGWLELGGAGIFRPEMTRPLGIKVPVLAWGLGIDRIGMVSMGISDIRELFTHDLAALRGAKVSY